MKFYFLHKRGGWLVELIKGRRFTNLIRLLIHCRYITTKRPACLGPELSLEKSK